VDSEQWPCSFRSRALKKGGLAWFC
jgi:hypothetical protein